MLAMHTGSASSRGGARSRLSGHGHCYGVLLAPLAVSKGPRPACALPPAARRTVLPSRAASSAVPPATLPLMNRSGSHSIGPLGSRPGREVGFDVRLPVEPAARGFLAQLQEQRRVVQAAAAGRGSGGGGGDGRSGGRTGGGGASGRDRGSGRDPADDMDACRNLEDLQALIKQRLPVWAGMDVPTLRVAFNKCGNLESRSGEAATAAARSSIIAALAPAYLPLVPRIRSAQDCSIPLWALGKAGICGGGGTEAQLAAALLERLVVPDVLAKAKPQELSNAMYGTSKLREALEYRLAVEALCGEMLRRFRTPELAAAFTPQALSNILLAMEGLHLGSEQSELVAAVAAEDVRRGFDGYIPQGLSNSAWALAKMGFGVGPEAPAEQRQWVSTAVDAAMRPGVMVRAVPQDWSNLLYALALMRHQPPPGLLDAGAAESMLTTGTCQACVNVLYALAVLQLRHAGLEEAVCGRLGELLRGDRQALSHQDISNSLWAMAVFGGTSSPSVQQLAVQLARDAACRWEGFSNEGLRQLWQAQQELGGEVAAALGSSPGLQAAMAAAVAVECADAKALTDTHKLLITALKRLERRQGLTTAGGLSIQSVQTGVVAPGVLAPVAAVVGLSDGRQVALELVGPTRFLSNRKHDPTALTGSAVMRVQQLRRAFGEGGVLLVPYWEWDGLTRAFMASEEQEA